MNIKSIRKTNKYKPNLELKSLETTIEKTREQIKNIEMYIHELHRNNKNLNNRYQFLENYLQNTGIMDRDKYKKAIQAHDKKIALANEIFEDDALDNNQKEEKAKENNIPVAWVVNQ